MRRNWRLPLKTAVSIASLLLIIKLIMLCKALVSTVAVYCTLVTSSSLQGRVSHICCRLWIFGVLSAPTAIR